MRFIILSSVLIMVVRRAGTDYFRRQSGARWQNPYGNVWIRYAKFTKVFWRSYKGRAISN
jgi:hypothetical protein